jgi:hypothetical protein
LNQDIKSKNRCQLSANIQAAAATSKRMSSKRHGHHGGGRKSSKTGSKSSKKSKTSGWSSARGGGQIAEDTNHNYDLPCCQFLHDMTVDIFSTGSQQQQAQERPMSLLGHMIRTHLLAQRQKEVAGFAAATTTGAAASTSEPPSSSSPNKKKKKRKKKKTGGSKLTTTTCTSKDETIMDENDSQAATASVSTSISQEDSQSIEAPLSTPAVSSSNQHPNNATQPSGSAVPVATAAAATTSESSPTSTAATSSAAAAAIAIATNPVEAYLDRLLQQQEKDAAAAAAAGGGSGGQGSATLSPLRDLEAFVQYLNQKHHLGGNDLSTISVSHSQLEAAARSIKCPPCKASVEFLLQQECKQPVFLSPISFGGSATAGSKTASNSNSNNSNNNHNGLAVPVLNEKPGSVQPSLGDFDYVALEEGTNPISTFMEAKADLDGIPYFHPLLKTNTIDVSSSSSSSSSNKINSNNNNTKSSTSNGSAGNKKQHSKASTVEVVIQKEQPPERQVEWQFVSKHKSKKRSDARPQDEGQEAESNDNEDEDEDEVSVQHISVHDLESMVKEVMIPLALPADDLLGAYSDLEQHDLREITERVTRLEQSFNEEMHNADYEGRLNVTRFQGIMHADNGNETNNLGLKTTPAHVDLDNALCQLLGDVAMDLVWDRLLWLNYSDLMTVIRPSPSWESVAASLTDESTTIIMHFMSAVETFEYELSQIANDQGVIPHLFISSQHRKSFRKMIDSKLHCILRFIEKVREASSSNEPAISILVNSSDAQATPLPSQFTSLHVSFRRKWFTQQEFYRQVIIQQKRDEAAAEDKNKRGRSSTGSKRDSASKSSSINSSATMSPITPPSEVSDRRLQTLDVYCGDLLRGLLELSKTVIRQRVWEIKEQHRVTCQKLLGLLARVGNEVFQPEQGSGFNLPDAELRTQCQSLWNQIQQQRQLHSMEPVQDLSDIDSQKRSVATMILTAVRLLRKLRKFVTDTQEPKPPPPVLPIKLVAWMVAGQFDQFDRQEIDNRGISNYDNLLSAAVIAHQPPCMGGGGQRRITSLLLALFYRKLSDQCSEWHAQLAEQELLTAMATGDDVLTADATSGLDAEKDPVGQNGMSTGIPAKANKKSKKKKDKRAAAAAAATASNAAEATENNDREANEAPNRQEVTTEKPLTQNASSAVVAEKGSSVETKYQEAAAASRKEADNGGTKASSNSSGNKGRKKKNKKTKEAGNIKDVHNILKEKHVNSNAAQSNATETKLGEANEGTDTTEVDENLGVVDGSGSFETAENYLVGRLTAILHQANSGNTQGSTGPSVIIV